MIISALQLVQAAQKEEDGHSCIHQCRDSGAPLPHNGECSCWHMKFAKPGSLREPCLMVRANQSHVQKPTCPYLDALLVHTLMLAACAQMINIACWLLPNAWALAIYPRQSAFDSNLVNICGVIRWTMWNTVGAASTQLPASSMAAQSLPQALDSAVAHVRPIAVQQLAWAAVLLCPQRMHCSVHDLAALRSVYGDLQDQLLMIYALACLCMHAVRPDVTDAAFVPCSPSWYT